ncbi:MAG TPA: pitrilysin family protein [Polyangia bacterium]|nr:pitrilysin family protein [Polyangia bacterium]
MKLTLQNGLRVVLEENHAAPVVAFQAWVGVGSADEPPELAGVAHVFEHMLFKGTAKRGVGQIAREVEAAGGDINAWTSFDETVYHLVLAAPFFDTGLDILADALTNPTFDPAELERERKVVLEEIKQGLDSPERVASQLLFSESYKVHPYGRPVIGNEATVAALTRTQIVEFFRRHYVAGNITLVVVGDFDAAVAHDKIALAFAGLPRAPALPARPPEQVQIAPRIAVAGRDVREAQLLFSFHTPAITHGDVAALDLLAVVLGQGESSRLNLEVVRNRQLASKTNAYMFTSRDSGLLVVGAALPPGRLDDPARAVLDEAFRLTREEISPDELEKARNILESDLIFDKETVQGYARKLGFFTCVAGDSDFEDAYFARLRRLQPADLRAVAARYLRATNLTVAALLPHAMLKRKDSGAAAVAARLEAIAAAGETRADRRVARTPTPAAVEEVVRTVLPSGLRVLVMRDSTVPVVSVQAIWPGGLRYEDARSNGISNLLAALMVRGTKTRTAEQIMSEIEGTAGSLGGFAGRNSFGVRAEFLSRHWERGFEVVADCIRNPSFAEDEIEHERRIVLDEIRAQQDNLGQLAFRLFHATLWRKHPYRLEVLGTADSVASLSRRKLVEHYRRHYGVGGLTIAIVGDVDAQRVVAKIQMLLGDAPVGVGPPPAVAQETVRQQPAEVFQALTKEQAHVVLGFPGTTLRDPDRFPLEILAQILSGQGGRLFVEMREKRALAYRVSAFSQEGIDPGYFAVYIACSPENLDEAVRGIRAELAHVVADGVTTEEVERARKYLVGTHAIGLQRKSAIAAALAFAEAYGEDWRAYRRYAADLGKLTPKDILRVARKYLDNQREVVAAIKPQDSSPVAKASTKSGAGQRAAARAGAKTATAVPAVPTAGNVQEGATEVGRPSAP